MSEGKSLRRRLVICSRAAEGYQLTPADEKHVQHMLTQWIPQAVFADLPSETARINVVVRRSQYGAQIFNKKVYRVSFFREDGSLIPLEDKGREATFKDYDEDLMLGKTLRFYDPRRDSEYQGKVMGDDIRLVYYRLDT